MADDPSTDIPGQLAFDLGLEADEAEAHADREQHEFDLAQLAHMREANAVRVKQLAELGRRPDPVGVLMGRLNLLLDMALNEDERTQFETAFETAMTGMLDQAIGRARQMSLLTPATPQQPVAGQRQTGLGGGLFLPG